MKPCHLSDFLWFLTVKKNAKYFEIKPDVQTFITELTHYTGTINKQGHSNMIFSFTYDWLSRTSDFTANLGLTAFWISGYPLENHRSLVFWILGYTVGNSMETILLTENLTEKTPKMFSCNIFFSIKHLYRIDPVMYKPWVYIESAAIFNASKPSIDQTARLRQEGSACRTYLHLIILSLSALHRKKCGFPAVIPWWLSISIFWKTPANILSFIVNSCHHLTFVF